MDTKEEAVTCSQIIEILQYVSDSDYYKIPKKERDYYFEHSDLDYYFKFDPLKTLEENNVSDKTKKVLTYLFKEYWATEDQKDKIKKFDQEFYSKLEKEKKQKYSAELFNDISNGQVQKKEVKENKELLVTKENIFTKIIKKIKNYLLK